MLLLPPSFHSTSPPPHTHKQERLHVPENSDISSSLSFFSFLSLYENRIRWLISVPVHIIIKENWTLSHPPIRQPNLWIQGEYKTIVVACYTSWASLWLSWLRICLQCGRPGFNPWVGKIPWRRERLPTPVFWPGEFHGLYSPWGHRVERDRVTFTSLLTSWPRITWIVHLI